MSRRRLELLGLLLLAGCPAVASDPAPPLRKAEIAVAPPHALGALAAGTDAAPRPDVTAQPGEAPSDPLVPAPAVPAPGGSAAPPVGEGDGDGGPPPAATAPAPGMAL
jgi:hypothetical protein